MPSCQAASAWRRARMPMRPGRPARGTVSTTRRRAPTIDAGEDSDRSEFGTVTAPRRMGASWRSARHRTLLSWRRRAVLLHCAAASSTVIARRRLRPSLRGREAAEAIQAGGATNPMRAPYRVALPNSGLLRARFARARNDGEPFPPSLRGGEAAEAIQAGRAACDGREAYIVAAPLLDCFARASRGLAMTEGRPRRV